MPSQGTYMYIDVKFCTGNRDVLSYNNNDDGNNDNSKDNVNCITKRTKKQKPQRI